MSRRIQFVTRVKSASISPPNEPSYPLCREQPVVETDESASLKMICQIRQINDAKIPPQSQYRINAPW